MFLSDENRSCKEVSVVYFDQGTGALHEVRWMKSSFFVFFSCFSLYFHYIWLKKGANIESTSIQALILYCQMEITKGRRDYSNIKKKLKHSNSNHPHTLKSNVRVIHKQYVVYLVRHLAEARFKLGTPTKT